MPKSSTISTSEAGLWGRLLELADMELPPEAARYILTLHFPPSDIDRMHALAEKAREGTLTAGERGALDSYERVGHALSLMKSKARMALKKTRSAR